MTDKEINNMKYIVRRLTPVECERLMGLPDGYTTVHFTEEDLTDELVDDMIQVKENWDAIDGKKSKPKTREQMRKWLISISTNPPDAPRFKACGNGWACNQPRWIMFNILDTYYKGWEDADFDDQNDCHHSYGINPQNGSLMTPFSHECGQTLAVGNEGGGL